MQARAKQSAHVGYMCAVRGRGTPFLIPGAFLPSSIAHRTLFDKRSYKPKDYLLHHKRLSFTLQKIIFYTTKDYLLQPS